AASSVNASRRRLTNSASPHQTESIIGHASTASASARRSRALQSPTGIPRFDSVMPKFMSRFDHSDEIALHEHARLHRDLYDLARGPRCRVGKHLYPFIIDRLALKLLHPHRYLDDVLDRGAAGLDDLPHVQEHERALFFQRGRKSGSGRVGPADETRNDDITDTARVRNGGMSGNLTNVNAAAGHRWSSVPSQAASRCGKTCALACLDARSQHPLGQLAWIFDSGTRMWPQASSTVHHGHRLLRARVG